MCTQEAYTEVCYKYPDVQACMRTSQQIVTQYRENSKIGNCPPPANLYYFTYELVGGGQFPIFEFSLYMISFDSDEGIPQILNDAATQE